MAKVAILVPYQEMCEMTSPLLRQYSHLQLMTLEYIQTEQVAARVRELETAGCELLVARGAHARVVRQCTRLPLVEIRVTAQELGMLMLDIKRELNVANPRIGLIGFANMFCDTTPFDTLFGIELRTYMVNSSEALPAAVEQAQRDGCRAVVGGDIVCAQARTMGLTHRFIPSGLESIRTALEDASRVGYAIDLEKRNSAEMNTMLDYTFTGIMQIDRNALVRRINRNGYDMLGLIPGTVLDHELTELLPNLSRKALDDALQEGREVYAFLLDVHQRAMVVNLAPIRVDGDIEGAILTFQAAQRIEEMNSELRRELYQRGYIARYTFDKVICESAQAKEIVRTARRISLYSAPVLLTGETGSGKGMMAQCIHNESLVHKNAYVWLDCSAWLPETLDTMLFGNYTTRKDTPACMAELAQGGTLYLSHVEALPAEVQYKLLNLVRGRFMHNGSNQPVAANVRVIASTDINLTARVEKGEFRNDLYYALSVLSLELPPLRRRREDIPGWVSFYLQTWQEKYKRYVHLTQGAQKFLQEYDWPGNLNQLNSLCERVVLLTEKRSVDEVFLRKQLERVTPRMLPGTDKVVLYKDEKAVRLAALLKKHDGNREKVAAELGVSKTTLWRYIKKYGIEKDYTY